MSIPFRERNPVIVGAVSLAVIATMILAAFRAQDLPLIGGGDTYYAAFSEAGGLKANDEVRIAGVRVGKVEDVKQLRSVAGNLDRGKGELDRALQVLPIKLNKVGRTAIYGSWFNFYLCHFQGRVRLPGGKSLPVDYNTGSDRCDLGGNQ